MLPGLESEIGDVVVLRPLVKGPVGEGELGTPADGGEMGGGGNIPITVDLLCLGGELNDVPLCKKNQS